MASAPGRPVDALVAKLLATGAAANARAKKSAAFDVEKPEPNQDHKAIAHDLDQMNGQPDRLGGCAKQDGGDGHDDDGDDGLHACRRKRQHHAAAPGLFIGDEIGRDHGFAVPGAYGMKNAIEKRDAEQTPHRGAIVLGGANIGR